MGHSQEICQEKLLRRPMPEHACQNVYELPTTEKTVRYLHASLGFPTKATMLKAIRNKWLVGWPGLTIESVNTFFPESDETQKGHMKQQRQGIRSTKLKDEEDEEEEEENVPVEPKKCHNDVSIKV